MELGRDLDLNSILPLTSFGSLDKSRGLHLSFRFLLHKMEMITKHKLQGLQDGVRPSMPAAVNSHVLVLTFFVGADPLAFDLC